MELVSLGGVSLEVTVALVTLELISPKLVSQELVRLELVSSYDVPRSRCSGEQSAVKWSAAAPGSGAGEEVSK